SAPTCLAGCPPTSGRRVGLRRVTRRCRDVRQLPAPQGGAVFDAVLPRAHQRAHRDRRNLRAGTHRRVGAAPSAEGASGALKTVYIARVSEIEELVQRGDAARLQELAESKDKAIAKEARRALHLLRTRGVTVAEKPRAFKLAVETEAAPPALASIVDGRGE